MFMDMGATRNATTSTFTPNFKFTCDYTPAEIQDGAHCGSLSYSVRLGGSEIGTVFSDEYLKDPDDESKGWVKEFSYRPGAGVTDYISGQGKTRKAAIVRATS